MCRHAQSVCIYNVCVHVQCPVYTKYSVYMYTLFVHSNIHVQCHMYIKYTPFCVRLRLYMYMHNIMLYYSVCTYILCLYTSKYVILCTYISMQCSVCMCVYVHINFMYGCMSVYICVTVCVCVRKFVVQFGFRNQNSTFGLEC